MGRQNVINLFANSDSSVYTAYEEAQTKIFRTFEKQTHEHSSTRGRTICLPGEDFIQELFIWTTISIVFSWFQVWRLCLITSAKTTAKLSLILYSIDVRVSSPPFQGSPFLHATEYIKEGEFKHQKAHKNFASSSSDALTTELLEL